MPPMPIVKGETEKLYSTIAEICQVDDLTDTSDESASESESKENSNTGLSVCQDKGGNQEDGSTPTTIVNSTDAPATIVNSTDALATVADIKEKTEVITGKSTVSNSGMGISTAAPSKSDTPKPDFRREKDKFDYRRDRERRRRGTNVASSQE